MAAKTPKETLELAIKLSTIVGVDLASKITGVSRITCWKHSKNHGIASKGDLTTLIAKNFKDELIELAKRA